RPAQRLAPRPHRPRFRPDPGRRQQGAQAVPADGKDDGQAGSRRHEGHDARAERDDGRPRRHDAADALTGSRPAPAWPGPWMPLYLPAYPAIPAAGQHRESTMVKIRLTRGGAKKRPFYHIIVTDSRSARDGRNIERVGFCTPVAQGQEKRVELNVERVKYWVDNGAQLTDKVADLYKAAAKAA